MHKLRNNTLNIKNYDEGLEAMEAALTLNKIFLSDQKTPFSPFLQSPISNTLNGTVSNFEYIVESNDNFKCLYFSTCLVSI